MTTPLSNIGTIVDKKLFTDFPLPWKVEGLPKGDYIISDSSGNEVMFQTTFTGDGARCSFTYEQCIELCNLINLFQ